MDCQLERGEGCSNDEITLPQRGYHVIPVEAVLTL